jgi:NAD(P)H-dependent flavin oxidoreductase YrpB (nitropropane dioxygenase family)
MVENPRVLPEIIQGGMGVGVSSWELARAVAIAGEKLEKPVLGVVSGTGLAIIMTDRLRQGDLNTRRALEAFPVPEITNKILDKYWVKSSNSRLPPKPQVLVNGSDRTKAQTAELIMAANFIEVWLAKQGHKNPIGINWLEKVQLPRLPEIYGAMLAGVDYVLMGAGIPNQVPDVLGRLANNKCASYRIDVAGVRDGYTMSFDPNDFIPERYLKDLVRPQFFAVVSSHVLAIALATRVKGVDGFVVEGPSAGGHNAPPRGKEVNEFGEPVYGGKDIPDLEKIGALERPYYLAGGYANNGRLEEAKRAGAAGIQVGSVFALCRESGLTEDAKRELRKRSFNNTLVVRASAVVSPSGFPFQVVQIEGTLSEQNTYDQRRRVCNFGYLVKPYSKSGNTMDVIDEKQIGFRCPAEPVKAYVRKGGSEEDTRGKVCLCVAMTAAVGHAPVDESTIYTLGKNLNPIADLTDELGAPYSVEDVLRKLFGTLKSD